MIFVSRLFQKRLFANKKLYTKSHEWVKIDEDSKKGFLGISDFAQNELGDITIIEMPNINSNLNKGDSLGTIESSKSVSDYYAPFDIKILSVNNKLEEDYAVVNNDAENSWIVEFQANEDVNLDHLLTEEQYLEHINN